MSKESLLLLHGALGASGQFAALISLLEERFEVHTLDFEGHGASPLSDDHPFSMDHFVENVLDYLYARSIEQANIFGYSMGGYVACKLALAHPERVARIATLGTEYVWNPEIAAREIGFLDPEKIAAKVPQFAQALAERHTALGWETVVRKTAAMLQTLGETGDLTSAELSGLQLPVRVMVGDRDNTVSLAEAAEIYRYLPMGELEVLPGTRHELEKVSTERLARSLLEFFL